MEIDDQVAREIATFLNEKIAWDSGVNEWIAALTPEPDPHDTHDTCCPVNHTQVNPHCFWCQVIAKARADEERKTIAELLERVNRWYERVKEGGKLGTRYELGFTTAWNMIDAVLSGEDIDDD